MITSPSLTLSHSVPVFLERGVIALGSCHLFAVVVMIHVYVDETIMYLYLTHASRFVPWTDRVSVELLLFRMQ